MSQTNPKHIIVMTGATSGIGAQAVKHFVALPDTLVLTGARGHGRTVSGAEVFPLDLASLACVRVFADAVKERLGEAKIEMLVLNAGAQFSKDQRSVDGFEMTFVTNHLSHYLLARLLLPDMAVGGRLVLTTSGTHDPAAIPIAPRTLDPEAFAHPSKAGFGGLRAYAASKLCNLLTARSFVALDAVKARKIQVIAYNPGVTGGTSLGNPSPFVRFLFLRVVPPMLRVVSIWQPQFSMGTAERAGEVLAELASGKVTPPVGRVYASLVKGKLTFPDPQNWRAATRRATAYGAKARSWWASRSNRPAFSETLATGACPLATTQEIDLRSAWFLFAATPVFLKGKGYFGNREAI